jgi:hypothetical protein
VQRDAVLAKLGDDDGSTARNGGREVSCPCTAARMSCDSSLWCL